MPATPTELASAAHAALTSAASRAPFTEDDAGLTSETAYAATAQLRQLRGARVVGRKIGFTNRNIWPRYNIGCPIWGDVTEATLLPAGAPVSLSAYAEPRLEPEIVLGLKSAPSPDMDDTAFAACIDWAAPGFEIVQSIYPGWKFGVADTIIAGGLHGGLMIGPRTAAIPEVLAGLPAVRMTLLRGGEAVEDGVGANALDGPLSALRHLVQVLADDPHNPPLAAGEVVTTGTLTDAWSVAPGEVWSARYHGVLDAEIEISFA